MKIILKDFFKDAFYLVLEAKINLVDLRFSYLWQ